MENTFLQRISINVSNILASEIFYKDVFNFKKLYHKTIPLSKINGYPSKIENINGELELIMLSQGTEKPMLGLMKFSPLNEEKSAALIFYTNNIKHINSNFQKYGGKITMDTA